MKHFFVVASVMLMFACMAAPNAQAEESLRFQFIDEIGLEGSLVKDMFFSPSGKELLVEYGSGEELSVVYPDESLTRLTHEKLEYGLGKWEPDGRIRVRARDRLKDPLRGFPEAPPVLREEPHSIHKWNCHKAWPF